MRSSPTHSTVSTSYGAVRGAIAAQAGQTWFSERHQSPLARCLRTTAHLRDNRTTGLSALPGGQRKSKWSVEHNKHTVGRAFTSRKATLRNILATMRSPLPAASPPECAGWWRAAIHQYPVIGVRTDPEKSTSDDSRRATTVASCPARCDPSHSPAFTYNSNRFHSTTSAAWWTLHRLIEVPMGGPTYPTDRHQ